jgi:outer membrane protein assembly factor BamB
MISIRPRSLVLAAVSLLACLAVATGGAASDWPQWRGPLRNGIQPDGPPLANQWPAKGLKKLWESETIPSDDDGGHGSVVAAGGRVYAAIVWHTDVPTETRAIDDLVMRELGYQSVAGWPKETVRNMEQTRLALDPHLMGPEFDKVVADWVEKNLDPKRRQTTAGFVRNRFQRRGDAFPLEVYDKLLTVSKKRFANEAALVQWLNEQGFSEKIKKEIMAAVPPTMKVAEDVVICLDLANGRTLWKCKSPGEATGRMASSTPCVANGRVYALGSAHFHAVDASSGKLLWSVPLAVKGPASSPLVVDGVLLVTAGKLSAFDAATGKPLWTQPKVGGGNSSPVAWKSGGSTVVICNGRGVVAGVDLKSGKILWTTPGGGDCTPAIVDNVLAVQTNNPKVGILAGKLTAAAFTRLWNIPYDPLRSQSSPLVVDGHVYLMDDNFHFCFDLATGRELWKEKVGSSAISSPVLADGKIFLTIGGGSKIIMLKPSPEKRIQLGKANVRALWCPSPAIADGKLLLRGRKGISCYSLTAAQASLPGASR